MGLDSLFDNDKEYKSSLNYILVNNNVCKTMKEINYSLNKNIDDAQKKNKSLYEDIRKNNINYQKAVENKKKKEEEEKKNKSNKPKFGNNKYNLLSSLPILRELSSVLSCINKYRYKSKNTLKFKKLKIC
jgi:hypothetical protein